MTTAPVLDQRRLLSISEAARELGLHPNSIRKAERAGRVPRVRREPVSGHRYFTEDDLATLRWYFFSRP